MDSNPLRAVFVIGLVTFLLGIAVQCSAQDCVGGDAQRKEQEDGSWIVQEPLMKCLLSKYREHSILTLEVKNLEGQVSDLESLRKIDGASLLRFKTHLKLEERATERAHEALQLHIEASEEADSWIRSPVLWFVVGVAVTSVAVVAIGSATR